MAITFDVKQIAGRITRARVAAAAVMLAVLGIGYYARGTDSGSDVRENPPAPPTAPSRGHA